jgi:serine/threonine protein kinase
VLRVHDATESEIRVPERFEVLRTLGRGGMGVVYEAFDAVRRERIALKTLRRVDATMLASFKREFRALADATHPNLVTLYELIADEAGWFLTMELVDGVDLLRYLRGEPSPATTTVATEVETRTDGAGVTADATDEETRSEVDATRERPILRSLPSSSSSSSSSGSASSGSFSTGASARGTARRAAAPAPPIDPERLVPVLRQLVTAIDAIHAHGYLHRDIKPSNVMVDHGGQVKVLDYGIIVGVRDAADDARRGISGTPAYMAPELLGGEAAPSPASDWYSVGVLLFEALVGRRPFAGSSVVEQRDQKASMPAPDPRMFLPGTPPVLAELCTALLSRDPAARPGASEIRAALQSDSIRAAPASGDVDQVVGRERELEVLERALADVRDRRSRALLLSGSPGIGKSILVDAFLADARRAGALVLGGRCHERESLPYKALDSLMDAIHAHILQLPDDERAAALPRDRVALTAAFPIFAQVASMEERRRSRRPPDRIDAAAFPRRVAAALRDLFQRLASRAPLVIFIDDVHWGDADSARILAGALRPAIPGMLFLAACRPDAARLGVFVEPLRAGLTEDDGELEEIAITGLSLDDARSLAERLLVELGGKRSAADRIAREADGNPYFVHELCRRAAVVGGAVTGGTLEGVIRARVEELSPNARRLLRAIALAGAPIPVEVAVGAAEVTGQSQRALAELASRRFTRGDGDQVQAFHDRIREVVTDSIAEGDLGALHRRLASALDARGEPSRIHALAGHYYAGVDAATAARAYEVCGEAGRAAAASFALEQAATYLEHAHEIAERFGLPHSEDLVLLLGETCTLTGRVDRAIELLERALASATDPQQRARIHMDRSRLLVERLMTAEAQAEIDRAFECLGAVPVRRSLPSIARTLVGWARGMTIRERAEGPERARHRLIVGVRIMEMGISYFRMDPLSTAQTVLSALPSVRRAGPSREAAEWHAAAATMAAMAGLGSLSRRLGESALAIASDISDPVAAARAEMYLTVSVHFMGEPIEAERRMELCLAERGPLLSNHDFFVGASDLAWNAMMRGRPAIGWRWIEAALRRAARASLQSELAEGTYRCYAGPLLSMLDRAGEGARHMDDFRRLVDERPSDRWRRGQYLALRALFLVLEGELGEPFEQVVREHAGLGFSPSQMPKSLRHFYVAQAYARLTQLERARGADREPAVARWKDAKKQLARAAKHPTLRCHFHVIAARGHRLLGERAPARRELARAAALAEATDNRWVKIEIHAERAAMHRAAGEHAAARSELARAADLAAASDWPSRARSLEAPTPAGHDAR